MKPGYKTTEGWAAGLTMFGGLAAIFAGVVSGPVGLAIGAASAIAYIASRTIVKAKAGDIAGAAAGVGEALDVVRTTRGRK